LTMLFCAVLFLAAAQEKKRPDRSPKNSGTAIDTVIMEDVNTGEKRKMRIIIPGKDEGVITIEKTEKTYEYAPGNEPQEKESMTSDTEDAKKSRPIYGITFSRIDLGLVKLMDNGSFTLSDDNRDFRYRSEEHTSELQ